MDLWISFESCKRQILFDIEDEIGFELSGMQIEWSSGAIVDTNEVYKYALNDIHIEGGIEA